MKTTNSRPVIIWLLIVLLALEGLAGIICGLSTHDQAGRQLDADATYPHTRFTIPKLLNSRGGDVPVPGDLSNLDRLRCMEKTSLAVAEPFQSS